MLKPVPENDAEYVNRLASPIQTTRVTRRTDGCSTCPASLPNGRAGRQCDRCKTRSRHRIFG